MKYFLKTTWVASLLVTYFAFTYYVFNGWWYSSIGTVLIVVFSYLIWNKKVLNIIGLELSFKSGLKSIGLALAIVIASMLIIKHIGPKHGVAFDSTNLKNYYHDVFYILNEEIVLGGIALYILIRKIKLDPLLASLCLALLFSAIHFVFYKWVFIEDGIIGIKTLAVLFLVGIVRNNLIIIYKHIGYAWALHFGWMVIMFGCYHYNTETNIELSQVEIFNTYLGSNEMLLISALLSGISLIATSRYKKINNN